MEDSKCRFCVLRVIVPGIPGKKAWFPGDTLTGLIEITSPEFNIVDLRVTLEGRLRVWMHNRDHDRNADHYPFEDMVEHQFLKMDCTPNWSSSVPNPDSNDSISFLQFDFTIPHKVFLLPGTENPEGSLQLPPSFEDGDEFVDTATNKRYKQPLVLYAIQTSVTLSPPGNTHTPLRRLYAMNEVQVLPRSGAQPPSATEDFPGEFQMASVKSIRIQRCCIPWKSLAVGEMAMSTREPPPINLDTSAPRGGSYCDISVAFTPANPIKKVGGFELDLLRSRLKSRLRVKTYYSTQNLQQIPQRSRCSPLSPVRLRSSFINLDTRDILMPLSPSSEAKKEWTTSICLPINIPLDMTPSFTSAFAARLYALNLEIRLLDLAHEPFKLEVPLQLVYRHGHPD